LERRKELEQDGPAFTEEEKFSGARKEWVLRQRYTMQKC
jgi:hypothetical protein